MTAKKGRRPSLAAKESRSTKQEIDAALDEGVRMTMPGGEVYELRVGDVTSVLTRELRAHAGYSFNRLMEYVTSDPDTDVIAAFIWLARRVRGEQVAFDDVVVTFREILDDGFDIEAPGAEAGGDDPEA